MEESHAEEYILHRSEGADGALQEGEAEFLGNVQCR